VVQVGDRRADYSLARRLGRLRNALMQRASQEIFNRREYALSDGDVQ